MRIPMPIVKRQRQALSVLEGFQTIKSMQAETAVELDALLPSILDKTFKGNL
jgi:type I restriction enzyme, S subunit